jgi:hypothetical protein
MLFCTTFRRGECTMIRHARRSFGCVVMAGFFVAATTLAGAEGKDLYHGDASPEDRGAGEEHRDIRVEYVTTPMVRNASLAFGGIQLTQNALDLGMRTISSKALERRGGWGIVARAAWSLWVDLPLVRWGSLLNHELGHALRRPGDVSGYTLRIEGPQWPFLFAGGGSLSWSSTRPVTVGERLASTAGGWEADSLLLQQARAAIYAGERMHYGDAMIYSLVKLGKSAYLIDGTQESRIASQAPEQRRSDPLNYSRYLAEIDEGPSFTTEAVSRRAHELRRGAYWNLVDYAFWSTTAAWVKDRIVDGAPFSSAPWIKGGSAGLAPSVSYSLTPYGPETTAVAGWLLKGTSGTFHVRWTGVIDGQRVIGSGGSLRPGIHGIPVERVTVDLWRGRDGKRGGRLELRGAWQRRPDSRLGVSWLAGVKSRGPLVGLPMAAKGYAAIGLRIKL